MAKRRARLVFRVVLALALLLTIAAAWVVVSAVRDSMRLASLRQMAAGGEPTPMEQLQQARQALQGLAALESEPAWRHLWLHTMGEADRSQTMQAIERAIERASELTALREANEAWLRTQLAALEQTATIGEVEAWLKRLMDGAPHPSAPLPIAAFADAQQRGEGRLAEMRADDEENQRAIEEARRALANAGADAARLRRLGLLVLPRPDRRAPSRTDELRTVAGEAEFRRGRLLADRVQALEEGAMREATSRQAAVALVALEQDPDLRGALPPGVRVAEARARIAQRVEGLRAWELERRRVEDCLERFDPLGAALALAALRAPTEAHARELGQLRVGFASRAPWVLSRGVMACAQRGDWSGARRIVSGLEHNGAAQALLDTNGLAQLERAHVLVDRAEDRALYEAYRAFPCPERAERYLEGWPGRPRAMAALVMAHRDWLRHAELRLDVVAIEWADVGVRRTGVMDMPDAQVEVWVEGGARSRRTLEDIPSSARHRIEPPIALTVIGDESHSIAVGAVARIDLRDALAADPVAYGVTRTTLGDALRAGGLVVSVADPAWTGRTHRVAFRATPVGAPSLPPYAGREPASPTNSR